MDIRHKRNIMPGRSRPRSTITAFKGGDSEKCVTGTKADIKLTSHCTWNVCTPHQRGKVNQHTHKLERKQNTMPAVKYYLA